MGRLYTGLPLAPAGLLAVPVGRMNTVVGVGLPTEGLATGVVTVGFTEVVVVLDDMTDYDMYMGGRGRRESRWK